MDSSWNLIDLFLGFLEFVYFFAPILVLRLTSPCMKNERVNVTDSGGAEVEEEAGPRCQEPIREEKTDGK